MAESSAEFVRLKVDVIVSSGAGAIAAKQATSAIPIIFAALGDPVAVGLVTSLARPGSNATGLTAQPAELAGKRLGLLREVVPNFRRLSIMVNVGVAFQKELTDVQQAAYRLGVDAPVPEIRPAEEILQAIDANKNRTHPRNVFNAPPM